MLTQNRQLELETSALLLMSRARLQAEIIVSPSAFCCGVLKTNFKNNNSPLQSTTQSLRREAAALRATIEPGATLSALAAEKKLTAELQVNWSAERCLSSLSSSSSICSACWTSATTK